ncbi:MAG: LPXTG cell wall anchor domain-containing protein [Elusimicrobiota bacterium]|nr:LPXTG cell wall anchor domain-containing protein [Elusimicrobiota bacterium]
MDSLHSNPVAILIGIAALFIGLVFYFRWKRRKDLEELASSMGLAFSPEGPELEVLGRTGLEIFSLGHSRKAYNLVQAQSRWGAINIFDYTFVTGSGRSSRTASFTLALIACSGCAIPEFELKPESFLHKIGEFIGFKDIDLPAFPLFSEKYRLTGPDETAVHLFFTPQRAAWFERNPGLRAQGAPGYIVIFKREGQLPVNSWQGFIEEVKAFAAEVLR